MDPQTNETINEETVETEEAVAETNDATKKTPWPVFVIMLVAVVCLIIVIWFVVVGMLQPNNNVAVPVTPDQDQVTEPVSQESVIIQRDPTILGLRTDSVVGQIFTVGGGMQTLYINKAGDCVGACLGDWTPYLADAPLGQRRSLGTVIRSDTGELQYSWEGQALYLYNGDNDQGSLLGDGYAGTWRIARP